MTGKATTYHIIGGGVAGLAAAKFLKQKNPDNQVVVYEAACRLGGRAYSFFDDRLGRSIDNATHVVLGANHEILSLLDKVHFSGIARFWNGKKLKKNFFGYIGHVLVSIFNTKAGRVSPIMFSKLITKIFPFMPEQLKVYFSHGDLSKNLIEPLSTYVDIIKSGYLLMSVESNGKFITALNFNKGKIMLNPGDQVISAVDALNYGRIFEETNFKYNEITNIFFRTSQALTLPGQAEFIATPELTADWIFINNDITAVTISDSAGIKISDEELARKVWLEIRNINGIRPAFLPPYRVMRYKNATLRQDSANNRKRPKSAAGKYVNLRIAGDWTMRNYPCSLEAAVLSAKRAVK